MRSEQRGILCPRCGSVLPMDSMFCHFCGASLGNLPAKKVVYIQNEDGTKDLGKHSHPRLKKTLLGVFLGFIAIAVAFVGYYGLQCRHAVQLLQEQEYAKAQTLFGQLLSDDSLLFQQERAYAAAGILMDEGKYIDALEAINALKEGTVPQEVSQELKQIVYNDAEYAYSMSWIGEAERQFRALGSHRSSEDYLYLIDCRRTNFQKLSDGQIETMYKKLLSLVELADAGELIFADQRMAEKFLKGSWLSADHVYYFELGPDDSGTLTCWYELPYPDIEGYYYIRGGDLSVGETEHSAVRFFRFCAINQNTIRVYCYADGNSYTLYRQ